MMRKFWNDYVGLCKESGNFYKKHWLGVIVLNAVIIAGEFAWGKTDEIKDYVKSKIKKEES